MIVTTWVMMVLVGETPECDEGDSFLISGDNRAVIS